MKEQIEPSCDSARRLASGGPIYPCWKVTLQLRVRVEHRHVETHKHLAQTLGELGMVAHHVADDDQNNAIAEESVDFEEPLAVIFRDGIKH